MNRLRQVIKYGWMHAHQIATSQLSNKTQIALFIDIIRCYYKYRMWSNQYLMERFYSLDKQTRNIIGKKYLANGILRDNWQKEFQDNCKFLIKYSSMKYEKYSLRSRRNKAYALRYNAGKGLCVENNVNISRQHYLNGTIKIGENVLLAKHVFIDYSGNVIIGNNVRLTNGVIIETHHHPFHSDYRERRSKVVPGNLEICDGAVIGSRAIIMPSCHRIGLNSRIGAGAIVTHDVPDYAVVTGVPARVIRYQNTKTDQ